jgi:hypothetical protein
MNAVIRVPEATDQVQAALAVLSNHHEAQWEARRLEREAKTRARIEEWTKHEAACIRRAADYQAEAAGYPVTHVRHIQCTRYANEQMAKAAIARQQISVERAKL